MVLTWRGALHKKSDQLLTEMGITRAVRKLLVVETLEGSVRCAEAYARRTSRREGPTHCNVPQFSRA